MDTDHVKAFIRTAQFGSFSEAAKSLNLAQPALSRQIQNLERELGITLIDREKRPIGLTKAGKEFLVSAQSFFNEIETTILRHKIGEQELAGSLGVVSSSIPGEFLAPPLLAQFATNHPRVRPSLRLMDSTSAADDLLAHRAEVAFLGMKIDHKALHLIPITTDEIILVVPATHPFSSRSSIKLAELVGQPMIEREEGSGSRQSLIRRLGEQGEQLPEYEAVMVMGTSQAQLAAIEAGVGIGFLSSLALRDRKNRSVVALKIEGLELSRTLYLAHKQTTLSTVAEAFVSFVTEACEYNPPNEDIG
jgi:DNA-binding transcriptional LysR family regulator